jgi:hypothetical protein
MGIFGAKRDEVTGEWRKLHNEELNDLYCSANYLMKLRAYVPAVGITVFVRSKSHRVDVDVWGEWRYIYLTHCYIQYIYIYIAMYVGPVAQSV